ncbi:MAG TPA: c-type cytochrome [Steroidobacteraceae bacterium]|nr:c-type cytochrome [Steroidobacteraceae bacterium]
MNRFWVFAAAISGTIIANSAISATAPPAGNVQSGAAKAAVCQACHGANGNSANPEWPSLAGLGAAYIAEQLQDFKDGKRKNPVMMPIAAPLSPQDMADLGAYFDSLVNTGLEADPSYWQAGEKLYRGGDQARAIPACMACHGPTGYGNEPAKFPALRGQHSVYVAKQLSDFASGARPPGAADIMPVIAKRLSPEDIRNLASYVQGLR